MTSKVMDLTVETIDGRDCVVLTGYNGSRLLIPANGLHAIFELADQKLATFRNRQSDTREIWQKRYVREVASAAVADHLATDSQRVYVLLDRGLSTELHLSFSRSSARELGLALVEAADHSTGSQTGH